MMPGIRVPASLHSDTAHWGIRNADSSSGKQPLKPCRETLWLSDKFATIGRAHRARFVCLTGMNGLIEWQSYHTVTASLGLQARQESSIPLELSLFCLYPNIRRKPLPDGPLAFEFPPDVETDFFRQICKSQLIKHSSDFPVQGERSW